MLISILNNEKEIEDIDIDVWLLSLKDYSFKANNYFDIEEIKTIVDNYDKEFWVVINKMLEEEDLYPVRELLAKLKYMKIKGIVYCSLAIFQIAKELEMTNLLVYQADTLITNSKDAAVFKEINKAVIIAKELPVSDILNIVGSNYENYGMHIHGFLNMSYSKRQFLTNYFKHLGKDFLNNSNYYIQEETRDNKMPIIEEMLGTSIYTGWVLESLDFVIQLEKRIKYLLIDSIFLTSDELKRTVQSYREILKNHNLIQARKMLPKLKYHDYNTGYHNLKTKKTQDEVQNG